MRPCVSFIWGLHTGILLGFAGQGLIQWKDIDGYINVFFFHYVLWSEINYREHIEVFLPKQNPKKSPFLCLVFFLEKNSRARLCLSSPFP